MVAAHDEALFPLEPVAESSPPVIADRGPVNKTFRPYDQNQILLLPPSLDEWLPQGHLARFVSEVVDETLDLSGLYAAYTEERGYPPYDPRLMLKLLIYGYTTGFRSSRAIERRCVDDVPFRWLAAGSAPDYRSIARFRRRHHKALSGLFRQALRLCQAAGLVRLGQVALDGTKVRASASRHKAMSFQRMTEREALLAVEVQRMLAEADRVDKAEDKVLGKDNRDDDLPGELARRETRLARIREAKAALEVEAQEVAAAEAAEKARAKGLDEETVAAAAEAAAATAKPKPKAQRNFTDPESRIMKMSDGSFHQCYNGQAVVDADHQVIVAADVTQCAADTPSLIHMLDEVVTNCGQEPRQLLADAGYCSEDNLTAISERDVDAVIATGRQKHGETPPPAPRGRIPARASRRERMARKTRTKKGKAAYCRRKAIVEPVFGQMKTLQDAGHLLLRGKEGAYLEWMLLCACHNLRKLFGARGVAGMRGLAPA
jgi:transposase